MATVGNDEFLNLELLPRIYYRAQRNFPLFLMILPICLAIALIAFANWPRTYTAVATIAPGNNLTEAPSSGMGAPFSAIVQTSLLGGSTQASPFAMYLELLTSEALADKLTRQDHMLQTVYSALWDAQARSWKKRAGLMHDVAARIKFTLGIPIVSHPESEDLAKFLASNLTVKSKPSPTSAFSSITELQFRYKDPTRATYILGTILKEADAILRTQKLSDVRSRIKYLESTIPKISATEQRQVLTTVLVQQEDMYTILKADKTFAYVLLDPPFCSINPTSPSLSLFVVFSIFMSVLIWISISLLLPDETSLFGYVRKRLRSIRNRNYQDSVLSGDK